MIRFDGVTKQYPGRHRRRSTISTSTRPRGKITVLVGPSGCGKTTSLRMVNRMIEPTSRHDHARRPGHRRGWTRPSCGAASATSSSTPGSSRTAPSLDNVAHRAAAARLGQEDDRASARASCSSGSASPRRSPTATPRQLSGRPAAAGRRRPGARRRPAGDAHGRAVLAPSTRSSATSSRTSSSASRPSSARRSSSSPTTSTRRSSSATRSRCCGSAASSRRSPSPPTCSPTRPTTSSPTSSAATAATARSVPAGARACRCAPSRRSRSAPSPARRAERRRRLAARRRRRAPAARLGRAGPHRRARVDQRRPAPRRHGRPRSTARCAAPSTPRCPRRAGAGSSSTTSGALCGTVRAHEVLTAIEHTERPERDEADPVHGGAASMTWVEARTRPARRHLAHVLDLAVSTPVLAGLPLVIGLADRAAARLGSRGAGRGSTPPIIAGTGLLYTIPSLALFILMPLVLGTRILDPLNVVVAMTIYTVALLVRTVADGLRRRARRRRAGRRPRWATAACAGCCGSSCRSPSRSSRPGCGSRR